MEPSLVRHLKAVALGEKPFPTSDARRHHFVPQFLLRGFCASEGPETGHLYRLDKTSGEIEPVTTRMAAWSEDLYRIEAEGPDLDAGSVEGFFGVIEDHAARSLRRFLAQPQQLTSGDRLNLSYLIALQDMRVPAMLRSLEERLSEMATMHAAIELSKKRTRRAKQSYDEIVRDGSLFVSPSQEGLLLTILEYLDTIAQLVDRLPWTLLVSTSEGFVTSDRPLTRHDPRPGLPWQGLGWLSSPTVASTVPLSSGACLRLSAADHRWITVRETTKQIDRINLRAYGWATQHLFAASRQTLERLHDVAQSHPELVPRAVKQTNVLVEDPETADPAVAARNVERGWPAYIDLPQEDGSYRRMSYEVIENLDDARAAIRPREVADEHQRAT